jgi:hypothetical protein
MIDTLAGAALAAETPTPGQDDADSLQAHFHAGISADEIEQVFHLKRAQPTLQAFTALFHGGADGVLIRLLVLRELAADSTSSAFSRADINQKLAYLIPESLETVLTRLRSHGLLAWDAQAAVYRVTPMARNVLSALDTLLAMGQAGDEAEMGFLPSQVAGAQAVGGVTVEQLRHLLGRLVDLTEEFRDAIASGSEFRLRTSQAKWHMACDWVEKGSQILRAILADEAADAATHKAAQAIGRAQSALLNMQGMFSRALNQIERQRVHLGQSGLSTTDVSCGCCPRRPGQPGAQPPTAGAAVRYPAEMIDAETELLAERNAAAGSTACRPARTRRSPSTTPRPSRPNDDWLAPVRLRQPGNFPAFRSTAELDPVQDSLLPASFAIASYRASLLPLQGDAAEASLQGATARLARLPITFAPTDDMVMLNDPHVRAMSIATLSLDLESGPADE